MYYTQIPHISWTISVWTIICCVFHLLCEFYVFVLLFVVIVPWLQADCFQSVWSQMYALINRDVMGQIWIMIVFVSATLFYAFIVYMISI